MTDEERAQIRNLLVPIAEVVGPLAEVVKIAGCNDDLRYHEAEAIADAEKALARLLALLEGGS